MAKKLLADSWTFFTDNVLFISLIVLPIVIPKEIVTELYRHSVNADNSTLFKQLVPLAIELITYPIYSIGVIFYIVSVRSGKRIDTKTAWWLGVKFWLPYAILNILVGLIIFFGLVVFIVPGIIFAIRYAFSGFDLLLNESSPVQAMKNSWRATKAHMGVLFSGYVLLLLALFVPYFFLALIFDFESNSLWGLKITVNIIYSVLSVLFTIFTFHVYELARRQQPNEIV